MGRSAVRIFLPVLLVALLCTHTVVALHGIWTDWMQTPFTHGYAIAAVSTWLLWRNTRGIPREFWQPDLRALPVLAAIALCWLFCALAGLLSIEMLLLPPLFGAAIWLSWGRVVFRHAGFSIAYLWFATSAWSIFNTLLQWFTVHVTRVLLSLTGVPAHFEGNRVQLPSGGFEIEGGCSGLNFFIVALALGALLGELRGDSRVRRLKVLALAALMAMFVNWIRVLVIVLVGQLTHMQHPLVAESHYGFGWVLFAIGMVVFLTLERRIQADMQRQVDSPQELQRSPWLLKGVVSTLLVVAVFAGWHRLATRPYQGEWAVPPVSSGWQQTGEVEGGWRPVFAGTDAERIEHWSKQGEGAVDRYLGFYRRQTQGLEFSAYGNLPRGAESSGDWRFVERYKVSRSEHRSPRLAQLQYALRALVMFRAPLSEVQVLRSRCLPDCEAAEAYLAEWTE